MMFYAVHSLESRVLLSFDPTAREQELLELLNRMRQDPADELPLLINSSDGDVNAAISQFHVNKTVLAQQWASLTPQQPLAWNESLYDSARAHSQAMLDADSQSHQLPGEQGLSQRIIAAGYTDGSSFGENIFAFAERPFHAHAGFAIDWGNAPNGIQNPPGHRNNMMDDYREVGIGILDTTSGKDVGPQIVTQDFGSRFSFGNPFLLGVVYDDADGDHFYDRGEGVSGANVHITGTGGTFDTTSMTAGGYQLKIPAGTYTITASGGTLASPVEIDDVVVGSENVKEDFIATGGGGTPIGAHDLVFGNGVTAKYTDASGHTVKISLKGPGTGSVSIPDTTGDATQIVLMNTTAESKLSISSKSSTTIGEVLVHGSLNRFKGTTTNLAGDFTVDDSLAKLQLANVSGGRTLTINGSALALSATFKSVSDFAITSASAIASIKATRWLDTDATQDAITTTELSNLAITGDFQADIDAGNAIGKIKIGGAMSDATLTASANAIGKTSVGSMQNVTLSAGTSIAKISSGRGALSDSTIAAGTTIGKISAGSVSDLTVRAGTSIDKISVTGAVADSIFFAGVSLAQTTLPTSFADFTNPTSSIVGVKSSSFSNTQIAAGSLGKLKLGTITSDNGATTFGAFASTIAQLQGQTNTQTIKLKNLTALTGGIVEDDFEATLV